MRAALPNAIAGNAMSAIATSPNANVCLFTTAQSSSPAGEPPAPVVAMCDDAGVTGRRLTLALSLTAIVACGATVTNGSTRPIPRVLSVVVSGHGKVTSVPRGISCPGTCRAFFPKDSRVRLVARPAAGWRLGRWGGAFCSGVATSACAFNLTTDHDCSGSLCKVGSFGMRASFVALSRSRVTISATLDR